VVEGSVDSSVYEEFLSQLLDRMQPYPLPNSVLVMDNASIHKTEDVKDMIVERCVFLSTHNVITKSSTGV
jgi:hypothetical protein